jgi:predicted metalloprotease with PDZ domain
MDGGGLSQAADIEPHPEPMPPPIAPPLDEPFEGVITVDVDLSDTDRGIFWTRLRIPVARPGPMTLLYPKWLPGYHSPAAAIELLAGIEVRAGGELLAWRRDPIKVQAFHLDVPQGVEHLDVALQYLSPTCPSQGTVVATAQILLLNWNAVVLYPAGHYARQIQVAARARLARGWTAACALEIDSEEAGAIAFKPVALDVLVDSPLMAGRHTREVELGQGVTLNLFADAPRLLEFRDDQIAPHRALIAQADRLFGARPFGRYAFLAALSDEMGAAGVEHQCSCEICTAPTYFSQWDTNAPKRDVFAHEYVHAWNGKHRRGADSWTASFERPIGNSLMWVYEGLTQFWGQVLAARSGLWTADQAREALGLTAAVHDRRLGGRWRPMSDTTRDPIIARRAPLPWASWQRSEDYYSEGQLMWLDIDTLIRERSGDTRSLDDFARAFFGAAAGDVRTRLYRHGDIVAALNRIVEYDWAALIERWLENRQAGTILSGLERGGYRLTYSNTAAPFCLQSDSLNNVVDQRFSIGLLLATNGTLQEVLWQSPSFDAGLSAGSIIVAVNGVSFDPDTLVKAVAATADGATLELAVKRYSHMRTVRIEYGEGLRYPRLEPIDGTRRRLDELVAPLD